ncbi:ABC transporter substrate-binding protein [Pseudonocardia spinosispora]|uniref:ABC transporter substrate-binding protein n=1 Tax=Pseudonocardia spinosispora TaxID=103441 RepID=UPI00042A45DE|nr:ABC transporter substrate-binding protein [Pseudonocardia spinosispora]
MTRLGRPLAALAVASLAMVLAACGSGGGGGAQASDVVIGFVPGTTSDPFFKAMQIGAEQEAKKEGVKLLWQGSGAEYSPQAQLPFVDGVLAQSPSALVLVPTDPDSLQASVTKAQAKQIPVLCVDTTVTDQGYLSSFITGDNVAGGKQAADTLAGQIGGKGKVFVMLSSPTTTTNVQRLQGFSDELKAKYPDVQIVGQAYSKSQPATATSAINTALLSNPDLAGIFAIDGTSGTGAVAALQNRNLVGKVKLVGYDAYKTQVNDLKSGVYTALIAQQPVEEGRLAVQYAVAKVTGKGADQIKKDVVIPTVVMTKDNLAETEKNTYAE